MQEAKKKKNGGNEDSNKKKERHIVTWTQQEDDILRQQITLHGTDNWAIIASKFKDKTTRQCRRRWYTYLNADFKKGGWSPEEDMLLCEAQKIFGNRWTEIAKVVSGRTDNAVKNRFSTLCKKRAKYEALAKENKNSFLNSNNKRIMFNNGFCAEGTPGNAPAKKIRRSHTLDHTGHCDYRNRSHLQNGNQETRPAFAVLPQNIGNINAVVLHHGNIAKDVPANGRLSQESKVQGTFLKKDDPKISALMQQAELLSSLAQKVNTENTDHSLEAAWKVLHDFLKQSKENDNSKYSISDIDFQIEDLKDLLEDFRSFNDGNRLSWRQPDLQEDSPASSEYSTGSTLMPYVAPDKTEQTQCEVGTLHKDPGTELQSMHIEEQILVRECDKEITSRENLSEVSIFPSSDGQTNNELVVSASSGTEFGSPIQVTPLFRSLAAGIPSPKFSESERNFLLKTLGVESPCPHSNTNSNQPPTCRRALLQSL